MHKSAENAALVADFWRGHPKIASVNYLGFLAATTRDTRFSAGNVRRGLYIRIAVKGGEPRHFACSTRCR